METEYNKMAAEKEIKSIKASLAALEAIGDDAVKEEAKKIREAVHEMVEKDKKAALAYVEKLKPLEQGILKKYLVPGFDILKNVVIIVVIIKLFMALHVL